MSWVYVLELTGGRFYVGMSQNVAHRIQKHINGQGAMATRQAPVIDIHSITKFDDLSGAIEGEKVEYQRQYYTGEDTGRYREIQSEILSLDKYVTGQPAYPG